MFGPASWLRAAALGLAACLTTAAFAAGAPQVVCHTIYGGEERAWATPATTAPYEVKPVQVGSYFLFKVVFQTQPRDLASVKIYVYADEDPAFKPIHHVTYRYPLRNARSGWGFTGLQRVYEPHRDGELEYWCEVRAQHVP